MAEISPKGWKTGWEKEKFFITSYFSFSHSVFKRLVMQTSENNLAFQNTGLVIMLSASMLLIKTFPNKPLFLRVCSTSLLKTIREKEKLLVKSNFSLSHTGFTRLENFLPFISSLKLSHANSFSFERAKNLSFGKGLRPT